MQTAVPTVQHPAVCWRLQALEVTGPHTLLLCNLVLDTQAELVLGQVFCSHMVLRSNLSCI